MFLKTLLLSHIYFLIPALISELINIQIQKYFLFNGTIFSS